MFGRKYKELKDDIIKLNKIVEKLELKERDNFTDICKLEKIIKYVDIGTRVKATPVNIFFVDNQGNEIYLDKYLNVVRYKIHKVPHKDQYYIGINISTNRDFKDNWYLIKDNKSMLLENIPMILDNTEWINLER